MSRHIADLQHESTLEARGYSIICGVDEAGRGPLAGPVIAAAVILTPHSTPDGTLHAGLADSKSLSQSQRERALNVLKQHAIIGIGISEPEEIDRINILAASLTAMQRAVAALPYRPDAALIDGNKTPELPCHAEALVKGDAKSLSVAAASIVAKVTRDRIMVEAMDDSCNGAAEGFDAE